MHSAKDWGDSYLGKIVRSRSKAIQKRGPGQYASAHSLPLDGAAASFLLRDDDLEEIASPRSLTISQPRSFKPMTPSQIHSGGLLDDEYRDEPAIVGSPPLSANATPSNQRLEEMSQEHTNIDFEMEYEPHLPGSPLENVLDHAPRPKTPTVPVNYLSTKSLTAINEDGEDVEPLLLPGSTSDLIGNAGFSNEEESETPSPINFKAIQEEDHVGAARVERWAFDKREFFKRVWHRVPYYVLPISIWLPRYQWRRDFLSDMVAGIGVGSMLVPQGLAYALVAGVSPVMGLYTAFFPMVIFSLLTTSKHMHYGPDALSSLLVGQIMLHPAYLGEDKQYLASVFAFICGCTLFILGLFRVGFLDNILSRPLLIGFVNAVAVIIFANQLETFLGLPPLHKEQAWEKFVAVRFLKYIIDTAAVVILGIAFSYGFDMQTWGVGILGSYPSKIPMPEVPRFKLLGKFQNYFVDALVICIIGFVESIVAVKIYSSKYNYTISPNRELVALGTANLVGSFFHTYPAFGSLPRSALGDFMGSKSQIFAFVSALLVLATILFLGPVIYFLPRVTMSAIIMVAAYSLIEWHDLIFLWKVKAWKEMFLLVVTFVVTFTLGVDIGIFVGVGISLFLVVAHTTVPHITILGKNLEGHWTDASKDAAAEIFPGILVVRIEEALYFANISQVKEMFRKIENFGHHHAHPSSQMQQGSGLENIVVHCKNITEIDASASAVLYEMVTDFEKRGIFVCFVKIRPELFEMFQQAEIISGYDDLRVFNAVDDAVLYIREFKRKGSTQKLL